MLKPYRLAPQSPLEWIKTCATIVMLYIVLGVFFGIISAAVMFLPALHLGFWLLMGTPFGAVCGAICSPIGLVLVRKDLNKSAGLLLFWTAPIVVVSSLTGEPLFAIGVSVLGFCVVTVIVSRKLPNLEEPLTTACTQCDYDLRGSLEFNRCPECGEYFDSKAIVLALSAENSTLKPRTTESSNM